MVNSEIGNHFLVFTALVFERNDNHLDKYRFFKFHKVLCGHNSAEFAGHSNSDVVCEAT